MSWSVFFVGKSIDVNRRLHEESDKLGGHSRLAYDAAKPHLIGLLEQNQSEQATSGQGPDDFLVSVKAHGSASFDGDRKLSSSCFSEIKRLEGTHA